MALGHFRSTLGHLGLQHHLLTAEAPTLEVAVRAGTEYLQNAPEYTGKSHPQMAVRSWEDEEVVTPDWRGPADTVAEALIRRVKRMEEGRMGHNGGTKGSVGPGQSWWMPSNREQANWKKLPL